MSEIALPAVGSTAPDFTLKTTGGEVTLGDLLAESRVLLAFFPGAFTGTCTAEMCEISEDYAAYERLGVRVLPISVDSVDALRVFKERDRIAVDLASDFHRTVSRAYGALLEAAFKSTRAYVLIDRDGTVRWAHAMERPGEKLSTAEIVAQLEALG
jgi:peroxiredoxin